MSAVAGVRGVELARGLWGVALVVAPREVLRGVRVPVDARSVSTARILGLRHVIQAGVSGIHPTSTKLTVGVWVDGAHAATALALALVDPLRARAAVTDAAVAFTWAALGRRAKKTA